MCNPSYCLFWEIFWASQPCEGNRTAVFVSHKELNPCGHSTSVALGRLNYVYSRGKITFIWSWALFWWLFYEHRKCEAGVFTKTNSSKRALQELRHWYIESWSESWLVTLFPFSGKDHQNQHLLYRKIVMATGETIDNIFLFWGSGDIRYSYRFGHWLGDSHRNRTTEENDTGVLHGEACEPTSPVFASL